MGEGGEFYLDDTWEHLYGIAIDRRSAVYRATTHAAARREADRACDEAEERIAALEREDKARTAQGLPPVEWAALVAAVFGPGADVS